MIIDDDPNTTLTFKSGIEDSNTSRKHNKRIEVITYNEPLKLLSEFKLGGVNREALREIYPAAGCFIKKPVNLNYLIERIKAELD